MDTLRPPPSAPPRERRMIRRSKDRRLSIILAVLIGLVVGGGAWMMAQRGVLTPTGPIYLTNETKTQDSRTKIKETASTKILTPHKALYNVALTHAKNGSQIIDIKGQMFFQMHKSCDGYLTDHRFTLTYDYADSDPLRVTSDFSTAERLDGKVFDFSSRRRRNGDLYQELRGKAEYKETGSYAMYTEPDQADLPLPPNTLFPAAHTMALIKAAQSGKRFVTSTIFDGSDTQGPVDVTAIITPYTPRSLAVSTDMRSEIIDRQLTKSPAWKMRLAFFPKNSSAETSDYELSMILHENGIISEMTIDYPDFTVSQILAALEPLTPDICQNESGESMTSPLSPSLPKNSKKRLPESQPIPDLPLR